jgi:hypothetical protein
MARQNRFAVLWLSQDGEPELVARPVAYFRTLEEAKDFAAEYAGDTAGGYVAIHDLFTEIFVEGR